MSAAPSELTRKMAAEFVGIQPASAPLFVVMQIVGGALGLSLVKLPWPYPTRTMPAVYVDEESVT